MGTSDAVLDRDLKEVEKSSKEDNEKSLSILVVCQYYYPENFQIIDICEELVRRGHRVTVLTGLPNYPTGNIPEEYKHGKKRDEYIKGVHVIRCYEIGRKRGVKGMALNYASYCLSSSIKAIKKFFEFDVIYSYQLSPIFMVLPAVMLKKKYNKPIFLYCCDLWPESMKMMLKDEDSVMFKAVSKVSTFLYKKCDRIAVQSEDFFEYFEKAHDIPIEKLCYIPQMGDDNYISQNFNESHDGINFIFLGNVGIAQDMDCILKAACILKEKNFTIHIVGDGTYLDECKRLAREYGIKDKIIFYGRRPVEEMPKFYKMADACLLTLKDDTWIGRTIPAKLQGYMAAGKPVIGAINGAAQQIFMRLIAAYVFPQATSRH